MLDHTGCDGVMIGRGALGNPWMLYRTIQYLTRELLLIRLRGENWRLPFFIWTACRLKGEQ